MMSTDVDLGKNETGSECPSHHDSKRVDYVLRDVAHEKCHDGENDENLLREHVSEMLTLKVLFPMSARTYTSQKRSYNLPLDERV